MNDNPAPKSKRLFVLALSILLFAAACWELFLGFYARIPIYLMGAALGFSCFLMKGRLPEWIYDGWDFMGFLALRRDDDPKNIPSKYSLPLSIALLLAVLGFAIYILALKSF